MSKEVTYIVSILVIGAVMLLAHTASRQVNDIDRRITHLEEFEQDHDTRAMGHIEQIRVMDELHRVDRQIADYRRLHYTDKMTDEDQIAMESLISYWTYLNGKLDALRDKGTEIGSWATNWSPAPDETVYVNVEEGPGVLPELSGKEEK